MKPQIAFISGPYRAETKDGIEKNIRAAEAVALKYWKLGYVVICPHLNTAHFDGILPDKVWLDGDIEILKRCDVIIMMQGWINSEGARKELEEAARAGLGLIFDEEESWNTMNS